MGELKPDAKVIKQKLSLDISNASLDILLDD